MVNGNLAINKKIAFNNIIKEEMIAGLVLTKKETKQIINHEFDFMTSFVIFENNEAYVLNLNIAVPQNLTRFATLSETFTQNRKIKLLLTKQQIKYLLKLKQKQKVAILPNKIYVKNGKIKLNLAICQHRNKHDKRNALKEKALKKINHFN